MGWSTRDENDRRIGLAARLENHPNLRYPSIPVSVMAVSEADFEAITRWACECCAALVSPSPKTDGEDEEIRCDDLAARLRLLPADLVRLAREVPELSSEQKAEIERARAARCWGVS